MASTSDELPPAVTEMVAAMPLVRMFDDEVVSFFAQPVARTSATTLISPIFIKRASR